MTGHLKYCVSLDLLTRDKQFNASLHHITSILAGFQTYDVARFDSKKKCEIEIDVARLSVGTIAEERSINNIRTEMYKSCGEERQSRWQGFHSAAKVSADPCQYHHVADSGL